MEQKQSKQPTDYLEELRESLPPVIARREVPRILGGSISLGHLQNLDSQGLGPKRFYLGRRACYLREHLLEWLRANLREGGDDL